MQRPADTDAPVWTVVWEGYPCPLCGAISGCATTDDNAGLRCHAIQSAHPFAAGGWFHALPGSAHR